MRYEDLREHLARGETITMKAPNGRSMLPRIKPQQVITIVPVESINEVDMGDVVFCRVAGRYYFHLVKAIDGQRVQISNNKGRVNGWTTAVYGRVIKV